MTDLVDTLQGVSFRASREQINALLTHLTQSRASPTQTIEQLLALERRERDVRNLAARSKRAALGSSKLAVDYDWDYPQRVDREVYEELLGLGFLQRHQNVLFRGPAGTGKTMLAKNLGLRALEAGKTVVFTNLSSALADLLKQESLPAIERRLRRYTSVDLLICDELGYQPIDARAVDLLFQIISRRHEQASTVITTNLPFKDWANVFPGASCLVPLVDRFTESFVLFDIQGDSYRQRARGGRSTPPATSPVTKAQAKKPRR